MTDKRPKAADVDEYIAMYPKTTQERLSQLRKLINKTAPGAKEIISYAIPTYKIGKFPLIYFAAFEKHIGLYPLPNPLPKDLETYVAGKGTLRFPNDKPLPSELIRKSIQIRLQEAG